MSCNGNCENCNGEENCENCSGECEHKIEKATF